jgi:hypothetical protein
VGEGFAPGFATDQRPTQAHHGGGDIARQGMLVRQPRLPEGTPGNLLVGQEGRHRQGSTAVGRIASCCQAARLILETLDGFGGVHPAVDQAERRRRGRSGVEGPIPPPGQVAGQDVVGIESPSIGKALGEANRHADRAAVAVPGCKPEQDTPNSVSGLAHEPC